MNTSFFWLLCVALCAGGSVSAKTMQTPRAVTLATEGRQLLKNHHAGFELKKVCAKQSSKGAKSCVRVLQFDVALAVKRGDEPFRIIEADGLSCMAKTVGFTTRCARVKGKTNGVNTLFTIEYPVGYRVYALRRVIGPTKNLHEVVYTPYADFLNTPSVRAYGRRYIDGVISSAYTDLAKRHVRSVANTSTFIHNRVPQSVIRDLILIEHMDVERFTCEPTQNLVDEVYTVLAVNQGLAYDYAKSTAAALGLLQVIPSTYTSLGHQYPTAGLIPDFTVGMTNHKNAAKAAILLADYNVGLVHRTLRAELLSPKNIGMYRDYVASAYNGGPSRAKKLYIPSQARRSHNSNEENRIYVAKMRAVASVPQ